jgi:hypothetical protein
MIFWSPPGSGKIPCTRAISSSLPGFFEQANARNISITDLKKIFIDAKKYHQISYGNASKALNTIGIAVLNTPVNAEGERVIKSEPIESTFQK